MKPIPRNLCFLATAFVPGVGLSAPTTAADEADAVAFFESRIRPVLVKNCYECHSAESGESKGGLQLDSREALRRGGDSGPVVLPGKPDESRLLAAIAHEDPDLEMPGDAEKLPGPVVADFRKWIAAGATDPRTGEGATLGKANPTDGDRFWSHVPPTMPPVPDPETEGWARGNIDRFVLARLEEAGLSPSADATSRMLLRRLCFDLVGLPPTPEQAARFSPANAEALVDELLASDGFGVRWGRHWLDVARFAESNGKESNVAYPHAWRYRDYVVDAFNADRSYDRFLTEQIAGDLLPADGPEERARHLVATGFLALGPKGLTQRNDTRFTADVADEQIDALTRAVIGTSVACARCHDHKSDPISMTDYYALAGIFRSTETCFGTWVDSQSGRGSDLIRLPEVPGQCIPNDSIPKKKVESLEAKLAKLDEQEAAHKKRTAEARENGTVRDQYQDLIREALRIAWTRGPIRGELATVDDEGNALPLCMGVREAEKMVDSPRYERGEVSQPGAIVPRGLPDFLPIEEVPDVPPGESGRRQLAAWLTHPEHPLTARVMVNRIWSHLFGAGLVRTVDNLGHSGEPPSHPELLDYLAVRFRQSGWSVKAIVREIVLSRTYRQASARRADGFREDPRNRLLWRNPRHRLDAEVIRDSMLAVSGRLDPSPRRGSLVAELPNQSVALAGLNDDVRKDLDGSRHRSIYLPVMRNFLPDVLRLFDFAEPSLVMGDRGETNVPPQALYLMNSSFVRTQAAALAGRVVGGASGREARIRRAFDLCFQRHPDEAELRMAKRYLKDAGSAPASTEKGASPAGEAAWRRFCHALLASAEFRLSH